MKSPHSLSALFRSVRRIAALTPMVLLPFAGRSQSLQPPSPPAAAAKSAALNTWLHMPLAFEPSSDSGALVASRGNRTVRIDADGAATFFGAHNADRTAVTMQLAGANPTARIEGQDAEPGHTNYLIGNDPSRWRRNVERFRQARVTDVYPGIDLIYYGNGSELEHDYRLAPHADPRAIRMHFSNGMASIDSAGALALRDTQGAELLHLTRPVAYQLSGTRRTEVAASYTQLADGTFGFALGSYDASSPLIIDPMVTYGTYFGGSSSDSVQGMQIDAAGNIYLLLSTYSTDMKTVGGPGGACVGICGVNNTTPLPNQRQGSDFFVAKFNPAGTTLLFGTYIGGSSQDAPQSLAVDASGAVYAWGQTSSNDFPTTANAYEITPPTNLDPNSYTYAGVLLKLSADGSQLLYSTYIGAGTAAMVASGGYLQPDQLALAGNGIAYVAGYTGDVDGQSFPATKNAQFTGGASFIAKFDTTKSGAASLLYATPIGPPAAQYSRYAPVSLAGLAVDSKLNLWISGTTLDSNFPVATAKAVQPACGYPNQCNSPYLLELDPTGQNTLYATFFGGTVNVGGGPAFDYATGFALDSKDNIYWGGRTEDSDFPTTNPAHTVADVGPAGWVAEFAAGGYPVVYSSYAPCWPYTVGAYKSATDAMLSFACSTNGSNYSLKNQISTGHASGYSYDAYFGVYDTAKSGANSILVESYLGAYNGSTAPYKTLFDTHGNLWLAGSTSASNLPVVNPFQAACDQCQPPAGPTPDGFVNRIALVQISPTVVSFPSTNTGASSASMTATISSQYGAPVTLGTAGLTDAKDFTATDNCGGTVAAFGSCTVTFTFTPQAAGTPSSTYTIPASDSTSTLLATLTVNLSGTAVGGLSLSPANINFPSTTVGSSSSVMTATLSNSGTSAIYLSSGSLTDSTDFTQSNNCGGIVAANSSCTVSFTFKPQSPGTLTSTYSIYDLNHPNTPFTVALSGQGAPNTNPTVSPSALDFGSIALNSISSAQTITVKNNVSGGITVSSITLTGTNASAFSQTNTCSSTINAGGSCSIAVTCSPSTTGPLSAQAVISFAQFASQSVTLSCTGTGAIPSLTPSTINFGSVLVGSTSPAMNATLSNTGNAAIAIQGVTLSYSTSGGFAQTNNCGSSLAAGSSCTIAITCSPSAPGTQTSTLAVNFPSPQPQQSASLSCSAVAPAAALSPGTYTFSSTKVGTTATSTSFTLSNSGTSALAVTSIKVTGTNASLFSIASNSCSTTLSAGASCAVGISFTPTAAGTFTASLSIVDAVGTQTAALSGTAIPATPPDFTLAATPASQSSYRGRSVSYNLQLSSVDPTNPFTSAVALSVTGLPPGASASFAPASVTPGTSGASSTLTITIPAVSAANHAPQPFSPARPLGTALASLALAFMLRRRRGSKAIHLPHLLILLLGVALSTTMIGCGDGHGFATPTTTSTLTVSGVSGNTTHTTTLTLSVQ